MHLTKRLVATWKTKNPIKQTNCCAQKESSEKFKRGAALFRKKDAPPLERFVVVVLPYSRNIAKGTTDPRVEFILPK